MSIHPPVHNPDRAARAVPETAPPSGGAYISAPRRDGTGERPAEVRSIDPIRGLVQTAKEGDRDAFGQLYRLHHASVVRLVRFRLGADHEDAVAEVFARAWAGLPRYRDTGAPFAAWLYGIARHVVADEISRRIRSHPVSAVPETAVDPRNDERLALSEALHRLPDEQRQVIELKYLVGLKNPEVAEVFGISAGAVNAKQWRALRALRELLEDG
jgi:RNA polymerase sigma-70 factor (ECF subfamily)